jgi:hypothetical protein
MTSPTTATEQAPAVVSRASTQGIEAIEDVRGVGWTGSAGIDPF